MRSLTPFQSTRPLRGATDIECIRIIGFTFQSTRPLRGATNDPDFMDVLQDISIHAPLAGRDAAAAYYEQQRNKFQSTRPLRGATSTPPSAARPRRYFNPRAPCGARHLGLVSKTVITAISIHAPLAGRDADIKRNDKRAIHFNPRAPCGARLVKRMCCFLPALFQSTRPLRGATQRHDPAQRGFAFQSTRPLRGATASLAEQYYRGLFQSTRPLRGATVAVPVPLVFILHFNPRAPCGARRAIWTPAKPR